MIKWSLLIALILAGALQLKAESELGYYADANDELISLPVSAAMAGADLSIGNGTTPFSCPANLAYDTINQIELSYASYFQNSFSTSVLAYKGSLSDNLGFSITAGYVFIPDISISDTTQDGTAYILDTRNCSSIYLRAALGRKFDLSEAVIVSVGGAFQAKRTRLIGYRGYGLGVDAGAGVLFKNTGVSASVLIENVTSNFTYWSSEYQQWAYPHVRVGLGFEKEIPYIYGKVRLGYTSPDLLANEGINYYPDKEVGDLTLPEPQWKSVYKNPELLVFAARAALEYVLLDRVAVRAGIKKGSVGFGAGVSLFKKRANIDFAYVTHDLAGTYQVGLSYRW